MIDNLKNGKMEEGEEFEYLRTVLLNLNRFVREKAIKGR